MTIEPTTLEQRALRHSALADVARLAVIDELALGDRSPSELQMLLGLPSNLIAHHLKVLEDAGLVTRRRSDGDRRRTYMTLADPSLLDTAVIEQRHVSRVMFVCSANSARSQLAAGLWARSSIVPVASAGTRPATQIAAGAKAVADRRSLTLVAETPQLFDDTTTTGDFVIAVCDNAYEELGTAVSLHWSIPDPVSGDDAAFDTAYTELARRVTALAPRLVAS